MLLSVVSSRTWNEHSGSSVKLLPSSLNDEMSASQSCNFRGDPGWARP